MFKEKLLRLSKRLYPTGRAFRMPFGGIWEKVNKGLVESENRAFSSTIGVLDSILPDNDNFTIEDAQDWERRLGLISNEAVSLEARKAAILRKMNHPGTIKARQHYLYLQGQLQAAGFNVYVHENIANENPAAISGVAPGSVKHGNGLQHGQKTHGGGAYPKVVNHVSQILDDSFSIGDNFKSTFFIGGEVKGTFALVQEEREKEFRQLILKLKPAQMVAFLFINYGPLVPVYDYGDDYGDDYTLA